MIQALFTAGILAVAYAGRSPNADFVESLLSVSPTVGVRYSDNVAEDALLDVPGLITKYGYPVEVHHVTTSDGYILEMHRIPHGRDRNNAPGKRQAVFIMHGLLSSSADFVVLGPGNALAYLLAEGGYDVWLGNARGNFYSRNHIRLNPDGWNQDFWKFSWEEIGLYDLPASIDYILDNTGNSKLHYIGHSQGGTTFLVLNSLRPEYNEKFISFQGLAPASYFNNNENSIYNSLAPLEKMIETTAFTMRQGELLPDSDTMVLLLESVCSGVSGLIFEPLCTRVSNGPLSQLNQTMVPLFLAHAPAGSSLRQVTHYGQVLRRKVFARFFYGPLTNLRIYKSMTPPEFDVSKITVPAYLYYGFGDTEVDYRDLHKLAQRLGNTVSTYRPDRESFHHYDFIWGKEVKREVYDRLIEQMADAERRQ